MCHMYFHVAYTYVYVLLIQVATKDGKRSIQPEVLGDTVPACHCEGAVTGQWSREKQCHS